jgi:hypothetical protein
MRTFLQSLGYGTDTVTEQNDMLLRAYMDLAGRRRWSWLETTNVAGLNTTIGAVTITGFPADVLTVNDISLSSGTEFYAPLTRISGDEWETLNQTNRDNSLPQYYAMIDRSARLHPRADKVYTVEISYNQIPPTSDLDADGDSPVFPAMYHDAIPWKVAAWLSFRQRDWTAFGAANGEYERIIREMEQAEESQNQKGHMLKSDYYDQVK